VDKSAIERLLLLADFSITLNGGVQQRGRQESRSLQDGSVH